MGLIRRRVKQEFSLEVRLTEQAKSLRSAAKALPSGFEREELLKRARQADAAAKMSEWLTPPSLPPQR
jgi:hypothetical protein